MSGESLREVVGKAIIARFEGSYREHGVSYDPDTAWEAADDVVAALVTALVGQTCVALRHPKVIGTYGFKLEEPYD